MSNKWWEREGLKRIEVPFVPMHYKEWDKEERISYLVKELKQRDGQYKELLNENERLEREVKWAEGNLTEKLIELNRYSKLVDDLMKVVDILASRVEGDE